MSKVLFPKELMARLPEVRGKLTPGAPLAENSWFRTGGPAEVLYKPADEEDLSHFLANCPDDIPLTVLGIASNVLIRDGGVPGVVIRLGPDFSHIKLEEGALSAGAAAVNLNVARSAQAAGMAGLEFLCGIPGSVGGSLRMNAGAHGREMKDIVRSVTAMDRKGRKHSISAVKMGFGYRRCGVPDDWIFLSAMLEGEHGDPSAIQKRMQEIQQQRAATQPLHEKTCGSTFANPEDDPEGRKAWQLIDAAGCRGLRVGKAKISEKHCNFIINTGKATAADIENLGEEVRRRVREKTGIDLRWEIKIIGVEKTDGEK